MFYGNVEYAGAVAVAIIWLVYMTRRSSLTRSSFYFSAYCIIVFITCITNVISTHLIENVGVAPIGAIYFFALWFNFSSICCMIVFLLYADSISKIPAIERITRLGARAIVAVELLLCATSPITGLLIHIDGNGSIEYGAFYSINSLLNLFILLASVVILLKGRVRFSIYQQKLTVFFAIGLLISNIVQIIRPDFMIAGFTMAVLAFLIYIAFENPAYFFVKGTPCQNIESFNQTMKLRMRRGDDTAVIVGSINDYAEIQKSLRTTQKDNLLRALADRLGLEFKGDAFLLTSDHFAIIYKGGSEGLVEEKKIEARVKKLFEKRINVSERHIQISVSTAILPAEYKFESVDQLGDVLEILLSSARENLGDDDYVKAEKAIKKKQRQDLLEKIVEKAIEKDSFMVYYQPILNVETGRFESAEALVRLIDEDEGFISPEEFIPVTERAGLILTLGEIIFRKVCTFLDTLDKDRLGLKYIEVNLSPLQCEKNGITDTMFSIMDEYHTDPHMINFEITETAEAEFIEGSQIVNNIIDMNQRGVSFSIDDFGSGFAAMDHLFTVPVDLVKVDKSILWQAMENEKAMIVLKNTFRMVQELHKQILVEGVETKEMVEVLKEYGCNYMQGYYFSKPIPEGEFIEFIEKHNCA